MRGLNVGALTGKAMELTSKIAKIDQDNYPETLEACYIINPPWAFSAAFGLVTRFLDEKTRKKVQVMGSGAELLTRLKDALGPDAHLPASALTGPLDAGPGARGVPADGLVGAHEVCFAYVAEREGCIRRGEAVDTPRALSGSASYAQLAALGKRPGAAAAAGGAYLAPPLWGAAPGSVRAAPAAGALPPLPLLPPPPNSPLPPLPPRPHAGSSSGPASHAHAAALSALSSPPPPPSFSRTRTSLDAPGFASTPRWDGRGTEGASDEEFDGVSVYLDAADEEDERAGLVNLWGPASSAGSGPSSMGPSSVGPSSVYHGTNTAFGAASGPQSVTNGPPSVGAPVGAPWGSERERTYSSRLLQDADAFRAAAAAEAAAAAADGSGGGGFGASPGAGRPPLPPLRAQPPPPSPRLFAGSGGAPAGAGAQPSAMEMEAHTRRGGLLRNEGEADDDYDSGAFNVEQPSGCCGCLRRRRR
jgi:hypothetical protein